MSAGTLPEELRPVMARAERVAWTSIGFTASIVVVMGSVLGESQTMKTAWIEDMLGFVPPIAFLLAARMERRRGRTSKFPFAFERVNGLGFFVAAVTLTAVGAMLLWDAVSTLARAEHATVGSVRLFGREIWLGWLMLAAQGYSLVPPLAIGRLELPLAEQLQDKLLHTSALMNKANWMTGAAGLFGVVGLGFGWWWADAAAAGIISLDILNDGVTALRSSTAELVDGAPRGLAGSDVAEDASRLHAALNARFPGAQVRLRETGRLIRAEVHGALPPDEPTPVRDYWPGPPDRAWRLAQVSFSPPEKNEPAEQ